MNRAIASKPYLGLAGLLLAASLGGCAGYAGLSIDSPELSQREPRALARVAAEPDDESEARPVRRRSEPARPGTAARAAAVPIENRPSPRMGTPEWDAEKAEEARKERRLNEVIQICRSC